MGEFRSEWQLGNDWNSLLSNAIEDAIKSMWAAHSQPDHYDEWLRSLQILRTLCIVKADDCKKLDKMLRQAEQIMRRTNVYMSDLQLQSSGALRKSIDDYLRRVQTEMISILNENNLIVRRKMENKDSRRPEGL